MASMAPAPTTTVMPPRLVASYALRIVTGRPTTSNA